MTTGRINQVAHPRRRQHCKTPCTHAVEDAKAGLILQAGRRPSEIGIECQIATEKEKGDKPPALFCPQHPKALANPQRPIDTDGSHWPSFEGRRETPELAPPPPLGKGGRVATNVGNLVFRVGQVRRTGNGTDHRDTRCHRHKGMKGKQPGGWLRKGREPAGTCRSKTTHVPTRPQPSHAPIAHAYRALNNIQGNRWATGQRGKGEEAPPSTKENQPTRRDNLAATKFGTS